MENQTRTSESSMQGKTCLITGGNSGIGKVTAVELARLGAAVTIVARNRAKGEAACDAIRTESGNNSVRLRVADLGSQQEIRRLADAVRSEHERLDVLVNNAGGIVGERLRTADGIETTFAVNHLAYFLLTNLLLDLLKRSASARIVNVASDAHRNGTIDFDNLQGEKSYGGWSAYARSKLANIMFTYELARRIDGSGVTANCLHPGVVATNFGASGSWLFRAAITLGRPFFIGARKGAATTVYLAASPDVEGESGGYYQNCSPARSSPESYDTEKQRRLWEISADMTGVSR